MDVPLIAENETDGLGVSFLQNADRSTKQPPANTTGKLSPIIYRTAVYETRTQGGVRDSQVGR